MSIGVVIKKDGEVILEAGRVLPDPKNPKDATNNVAEFSALAFAFEELKSLGFLGAEVLIRGDSQLVINQLWGNWRMNAGAYVPFAKYCKAWLAEFSTPPKGEWVPRDRNAEADALSKKALAAIGVVATERR